MYKIQRIVVLVSAISDSQAAENLPDKELKLSARIEFLNSRQI